ncbi:hypothetical protein F4824DRAFT_439693 [Ustulina deusta]|nr:hypothetical protein F4824DRAFT_439693 [Ustulina deusta]
MYIPDVRHRDSVPPDPRSELSGAEQRQQVFPVSHITTHTPNDTISNPKHHQLLAWAIKTISTVIFNDVPPSSPAISLAPVNSNSLGKRDDNGSPNTTTSVVAGILVTAFVILAGIFLYVYRRSIRFRQQSRKRRRHHRHGRRPSGVSKMSQGSDAVGGGGADGAPDAAAAPPEPAAQA